MNVTVNWTLSGGDSADFYFINITTNAPQTPYGGILNITTAGAGVTQHEITGFMAGYEYNITVRGVTANCGGLFGRESEPLMITPQGRHKTLGSDLNPLTTNDAFWHCQFFATCYQLVQFVLKIVSALAEWVGQGEVGARVHPSG